MKILQLCKKFPFPLKDGESIAIKAIASGLSDEGAAIDLLSFNTTKHWIKVSESLKNQMDYYRNIEWIELDNQVRPIEAFFNIFSSVSYNISRFIDMRMQEALSEMLVEEDYDIVLIESIYMMPYVDLIRSASNAKIVLRAHNIEHRIWERLADNTSKSLHKWYFVHCAKKLKNFEVEQLGKIDLILPISPEDEKFFIEKRPDIESYLVPAGILTSCRLEDATTEVVKMGFVGSLDWMPNLEGITWFVDEVFPRLRARWPKLEMHVAGRNTPEWLLERKDHNVFVHGEVENVESFLSDKQVVVVPLFSGSGIRIKILEAMSLGKLVISTSVGIEGIDAEPGIHFLKADTPEDFETQLHDIFDDLSRWQRIASTGQDFVLEGFDNKKLSKGLFMRLMSMVDVPRTITSA